MVRSWISFRQASFCWIAIAIIGNSATAKSDDGLPLLYECETQFIGPFEQEDVPHIKLARSGCVRKYGPGACLVKLTKVDRLAYRAICRRAQ